MTQHPPLASVALHLTPGACKRRSKPHTGRRSAGETAGRQSGGVRGLRRHCTVVRTAPAFEREAGDGASKEAKAVPEKGYRQRVGGRAAYEPQVEWGTLSASASDAGWVPSFVTVLLTGRRPTLGGNRRAQTNAPKRALPHCVPGCDHAD